MSWLRITPIDALFFRDGRPYTQGDAAQTDVLSGFPPSPLTLTGSLRAALARANGWNGSPGSWSALHTDTLGDGPEAVGRLSFRGPFVCRADTILIPAPLHVLGRPVPQTTEFALLSPGVPADCDLGVAVRLPQLQSPAREQRDWHALSGSFMSTSGLGCVARGAAPSTAHLVKATELWAHEPRTSLQRNRDTHATGDEGNLYSPGFIRVEREVGFAVEVRGVPVDWLWPSLMPFGGEGRMAAVEQTSPGSLSVDITADVEGAEVALICLTPLRLPVVDGKPIGAEPGSEFFKALGVVGAEVVSVCAERPVMLGGWNSRASEPLPLRPCLAAGSVIFCRVSQDGRAQLRESTAGGIEPDGHLGFNQIALGSWPANVGNGGKHR